MDISDGAPSIAARYVLIDVSCYWLVACDVKFSDGKELRFSFLDSKKAADAYLKLMALDASKFCSRLEEAAELLRYRFFSHGLFWRQLGEMYGGHLTELEWRLLFRVLITAASNQGEFSQPGNYHTMGLLELVRVMGMASTGLGNAWHWATIQSSLNPTTTVFDGTPVLHVAAPACQATTAEDFLITPLMNFDSSQITEYMQQLSGFQANSSTFFHHFFACFLPLHRFHLLHVKRTEIVPQRPPDSVLAYYCLHLLVTPYAMARVADPVAFAKEYYGAESKFMAEFHKLGASIKRHSQLYNSAAADYCNASDKCCLTVHEEWLQNLDSDFFTLFEPYHQPLPSPAPLSLAEDKDDDDAELSPVSPSPPSSPMLSPRALPHILPNPLLMVPQCEQEASTFFATFKAVPDILRVVSKQNLHHFLGYCICIRAMNDLYGIQELLSPSETIQLHVFLGKEAKEGAYKVDVTLATNEMKELEESAHCIYREGLALEEGAGISFGGYRALFSRFQPALDKEYTLYLRFH